MKNNGTERISIFIASKTNDSIERKWTHFSYFSFVWYKHMLGKNSIHIIIDYKIYWYGQNALPWCSVRLNIKFFSIVLVLFLIDNTYKHVWRHCIILSSEDMICFILMTKNPDKGYKYGWIIQHVRMSEKNTFQMKPVHLII